MNHAELTELVTSKQFTDALEQAARITREGAVEAGWAVFDVPVVSELKPEEMNRLTAGRKLVSEVLDAREAPDNLLDNAYDAMMAPHISINMSGPLERMIELPLNTLIHSHPIDPHYSESVDDLIVPSPHDLQSSEAAWLEYPGIILGILAVNSARKATLLLYRRTDPQAPNIYQMYNEEEYHPSLLRELMLQSGIAIAELQYSLKQQRYLGNVALRLAGLFPQSTENK